MATLLTDIPAISYAFELDTIDIDTGGGAEVTVELRISNSGYRFRLLPDEDHEVILTGMADLICDHLGKRTGYISINLDGVRLASTTCVPARLPISISAATFVATRFLTRGYGPKQTYRGMKEYISAYLKNEDTLYTVVADFRSAGGGYESVTFLSKTITHTNNYDTILSVDAIAGLRPSARLLRFTATMGDRVQVFNVTERPMGGLAVYMRNSMGGMETVCLPLCEQQLRPKVSCANVGGRRMNYRIKDETRWECANAMLCAGEVPVMEDLLISKEIHRMDDDTPLRIAEGSVAYAADGQQYGSVKVTLEQAQIFKRVTYSGADSVFDETFDDTFS